MLFELYLSSQIHVPFIIANTFEDYSCELFVVFDPGANVQVNNASTIIRMANESFTCYLHYQYQSFICT